MIASSRAAGEPTAASPEAARATTRRSRWAVPAWSLVAGALGAYAVFLGYRSSQVYAFLKSEHAGFRGRLHREDAELGFAPIPGACGERLVRRGPPVPACYDAEGFRVPGSLGGGPRMADRRRPLVLALGCSFTYGDAARAEEAYPARVAARLDGTALNAGRCAYGLSQMLLLARRLIPQYRPDYVLAQHSPWLAGRGASGFARATFGRVPVPYFAEDPGGFVLRPPVFSSVLFRLPFERFDRPRRGVREATVMFARATLPLFLYDDAQMAAYHARRFLGLLPAPATDLVAVERAAYVEMATLAREHGARLVVVHLSQPLEKTLSPSWDSARRAGALAVDAQEALNRRVLDGRPETYSRMFRHWRGDPPEFVDPHPNATAHEIIAEAVVAAVRADAGAPASRPAATAAPPARPDTRADTGS